jgi:molybdopterin guanine dinucleotide-containing S/N-oxide reductase-like protein
VNKDHSEKTQNEETKKTSEVTRRDFLVGAGTVVVGGAIGAGLLSGCGETVTTTVKETTTKTVPTTVTSTETKTVAGEDGEVITVTKTVTEPGSGGGMEPALEPEEVYFNAINCPGHADVKNGKIIRIRPIHYNRDNADIQGWTYTARGKSWTPPLKSKIGVQTICRRKRTDSPNRILYPLQRVDWEPGGDPDKINAQNRGKSKYKRISWDEATTIIANEIKRVADTYGPSALTCAYSGGHSEGHSLPGSHGCQEGLLQYFAYDQYGGFITSASGRATTSSGGQLGGRYVIGDDYESGSGVFDSVSQNCEMLLGWACNETHSWYGGMIKPLALHWWNKEVGIPVISIAPEVHKTAGIHTDKFIPIVPNTDAALACAIAYVWFTEDSYDKDYIATHAYGFDKWEAYVMGDAADGIAKTPEWASAITLIPVYTIKALAREWASKPTSIMFGVKGGGANGRTIYGDNVNRMQLYLLGMQGWGKPGVHQISSISGNLPSGSAGGFGSVSGNSVITTAFATATGVRYSATDLDKPFIPRDDWADCLLNPPVEWWPTSDQGTRRVYPQEGFSEVHLCWATSQSYTGSRANGNLQRRGFQSPKLECHITMSMWLEDCMKYSDIILPIATLHELLDVKTGGDVCSVTYINKPATKPKGEAKSDLEATLLVAEKLGMLDKIVPGYTNYQDYSEAKAREAYDNGSVKDLISFEDLNKPGAFVVADNDPATAATKPSSTRFYENAETSPLRTPSGKMEYESQTLMEWFPDDMERAPTATYVPGGPASEGWTHDEDPWGERANTYPIRVVSQTNDWLHHSQYVDVPWTREVRPYIIGFDGYAYSPIWINPVDADARGIKDGDIVRVYNERGSVLAGAMVTEKVMPQAIRFDKAGGDDQISPDINRGGNPNSINVTPPMHKHGYGLACQYYLAEVEKVTGDMMEQYRDEFPEAFLRDYDPQYGPLFKGWIEGEE